MNTQSPARCPGRPQIATLCAPAQRIADAARARAGHVEVSLAHASGPEATYGCVDWYMYDKTEPRQ